MEQRSAASYRINTPKVIHDTVDEEALAIDSTSGVYFLIRAAGAVIWGLIERGCDVAAMVTALERRYDCARDLLEADLHRFLGELQREDLIAPCDARGVPPEVAGSDDAPRSVWVAPVLEKFTDMERLLLIDPIHLVEDDGWPYAKKSSLES